MKFFRLLRGHWLAFLLCLCLLIGQAWSDLALPGLMSEIVDVGIQQGGIDSPLPATVRTQTLSDLEMFMDSDAADKVDAAYGEPDADDIRSLTSGLSDQERTELEGAIALPATIVLALQEGTDAQQLFSGTGFEEEAAGGAGIEGEAGTEAEVQTDSEVNVTGNEGAVGVAYAVEAEDEPDATAAVSGTGDANADGGQKSSMFSDAFQSAQRGADIEAPSLGGGMASAFLGSTGVSASDISTSQLLTLLSLQSTLEANGGVLTIDEVRTLAEAQILSPDDLAAGAQSLMDSFGAMGGTIVRQRAVSFVSREYAEQGVDLNAIQFDYLWRMTRIMLAYCAVALVCAILVALIASRTAATVSRDLRHDVFAKVMSFSPAEVNAFSQASLITRCTNDVQQIQMVCVMFMRMVMLAPVMGVVALTRVLATHTGLEWTIGVALVLVLAGLGLLLGFTMPKFKLMQTLIDRVNLKSREMLDGLMPMRAFGRQEYELEGFDRASTDLMRTQLFTSRAMALAMPLLMLVMNGITLLIVWFGAHGINDGVMQVGDMMAFISYAMQIIMSFMILSMVLVMLPRASVAADRICAVLDKPLSIVDPQDPAAPDRTGDAPMRGVIRFDDVSFRYPDADADAVEHVSFSTAPGKTTAIIGPTGSGKTSIVQLIPRLFDVTDGTVSIDGVDVRNMALADLRSRIGYVPQQGMLFSGTIESNVGFGLDAADPDVLERACGIAQASGFIAEKEGGMQAAVSQRGANVSGGQRQRLSIARALAVQPEVLVFDDSFSALDYATDAALREALRTQLADTAVVTVAQRIATIMHADEILVLEEGRVVGRGTHRQLLKTCPTYLEIAKSQLSPKELGIDDDMSTCPLEGGDR